MDLNIANKEFIVLGSTSGFGLSITETLLKEGAKVIVNARTENKLHGLFDRNKGKVTGILGDITQEETQAKLLDAIKDKTIDGLVMNASGPPTGNFEDIDMEQWDEAYSLLIRWKVMLIKSILPKFIEQGYGRIVFIESMSVKQPIDNLLLSNVYRMSIVGLSKSLSQEYSDKGITFNVLAPGMHETPALKRVITKKSETQNISYGEAKKSMMDAIPVKRLGNPYELASIASWLLSPISGFVTGQVIGLEGGAIRYSLG